MTYFRLPYAQDQPIIECGISSEIDMAINTPHPGSPDTHSSSVNPIGTPLATEATESGEEPSDLELGIPIIISRSQAAFRRDLPRLLAERPGQWVAYQGDQQIGFGATKTELYQKCLRRGLKRDEFLVRSIEPEMDVMVLGPRVLG